MVQLRVTVKSYVLTQVEPKAMNLIICKGPDDMKRNFHITGNLWWMRALFLLVPVTFFFCRQKVRRWQTCKKESLVPSPYTHSKVLRHATNRCQGVTSHLKHTTTHFRAVRRLHSGQVASAYREQNKVSVASDTEIKVQIN